MMTKTLELKRGRYIRAELFEDGAIGLEFVKDGSKIGANYKNGDSDYHEVYMNLTYDELDAMVEFLMNLMSINLQGGIVIDTDNHRCETSEMPVLELSEETVNA